MFIRTVIQGICARRPRKILSGACYSSWRCGDQCISPGNRHINGKTDPTTELVTTAEPKLL